MATRGFLHPFVLLAFLACAGLVTWGAKRLRAQRRAAAAAAGLAPQPPYSPLNVEGPTYRGSLRRALRRAAFTSAVVAFMALSAAGTTGSTAAFLWLMTLLAASGGVTSILTVRLQSVQLGRDGLVVGAGNRKTALLYSEVLTGHVTDATWLGAGFTVERRSHPAAPVRRPGLLVLQLQGTRRVLANLTHFEAPDADAVLRHLAARGIHIAGSPHTIPTADQGAAPVQPASGSLATGVLAATLVALLGAGAWALVAKATGLEFGLLASAIGAACGFAVFRASGRTHSVAGAVAAVALSILATVAGKYLALGLFVQADLLPGEVLDWVALAAYFLAHVLDFFGPLDLLFLALAVYAAWRIAGPRRTPQAQAT